MKTLLVAALVLVPCLAFADATTDAPAAPSTPPELAGLTPEQQKLAEPILAAEVRQKKLIQENKSMQPVQKQAEISNLHRSTMIQIQALKTPPPAPAHP